MADLAIGAYLLIRGPNGDIGNLKTAFANYERIQAEVMKDVTNDLNPFEPPRYCSYTIPIDLETVEELNAACRADTREAPRLFHLSISWSSQDAYCTLDSYLLQNT